MVSIREFDICRVTGQKPGSVAEFAVVLQHDTSFDLSTRVVAPLLAVDDKYRVDRATVAINVLGKKHVMAVHLMGAVPARNLEVVDSVADREGTIKNAIDFLFFGI